MTPSPRSYLYTPLEKRNVGLEERLEKNDVNRITNSITNIKERIIYFKDRTQKSKEKFKREKTLTSIVESVDTVLNIGSTTSFVTLSVTGSFRWWYQSLLDLLVLYHTVIK